MGGARTETKSTPVEFVRRNGSNGSGPADGYDVVPLPYPPVSSTSGHLMPSSDPSLVAHFNDGQRIAGGNPRVDTLLQEYPNLKTKYLD